MDDLAAIVREVRTDLSVLGPPGIDEAIANAVRTYLESPEVVERVTASLLHAVVIDGDAEVTLTFEGVRAALNAAGGKQDA